MTSERVRSSQGVDVALHELAGEPGLPPLLISHATGFHAHCYTPIADMLADRFHVVGLDYRGHGESPVAAAWAVDWARFGDDALAVSATIADRAGRPLIGFGHSMGGAALLMAAHRRPELFERLVLFEPISHEGSTPGLTDAEMRALPIVAGALRRRREFPSYVEAYENYRHKAPMSLMVPQALRDYVDHGFRDIMGADGEPAVELRCTPELEAAIFVTGRANGVWALLPEIEVPCVVVTGHVDDSQPSASARAIADRLPAGQYVELDHQTHFGPFSHPRETADVLVGGRPSV